MAQPTRFVPKHTWHNLPSAEANLCIATVVCEPCLHNALFGSDTFILIQKRHPYTRTLNKDMSGDSENALLHCADV